MARPRPGLPSGHGELTARPPVGEWAALARENAALVRAWEFPLAGMPVGEARREARRVLTAAAAEWTASAGIAAAPVRSEPELVIATGHQPELYHTGVWVKDFLLQRVAEEAGAVGVDVVVDTDTFRTVGVSAPCLRPGVTRCRQYLAVGTPETCYACAPAPSAEHVERFCEATAEVLGSLPAPSVARHFATFCESLRAAEGRPDLASFLTVARRHFEGGLTDYLELPVTAAARTEPFARFALELCGDAERFATVHNDELAAHRALHRVRSTAQPFPDLVVEDDAVEVPLWLVGPGGRHPARVRRGSGAGADVEVLGPDGVALVLPPDPLHAAEVLGAAEVTLAPRALALTLFFRTLFADLFIHGIGGARYDRVTEGVAKRLWGIDLPPFATASLTMYLPLGAHVVTEEDVAEVDRRLHRLTHNPDESLGDVEFDSAEERDRALALAAEKRALIEAIGAEGADRKALGLEIRARNEELAVLLEPLADELRETRERLVAQVEAADVFTDRTYPYCFWSPDEVADKAR